MSKTIKIGIIIQCRDKSTRMKHKAVRPFHDGKSILEIIIQKFKSYNYPIVVATCANSKRVIKICNKTKTDYYIGDEYDVLGRMYGCAKSRGFDAILRVCADNPFVSLGLMYPVITWGEIGEYDYVSFDSAMRRHEGFFLEYVSIYALGKSAEDAILETDREHVTPYIVRHPCLFVEKILSIPPELNEISIRLTVDSEQDFETAQEVYEHIGEKHWHFIIKYVEHNKLMQANMLREIALNPKRVQ